MTKSKIEWTDETWNPVTGCNKISPGCKHCYADSMAKRLQAMKSPHYRNGFKLTLQPHRLEYPLKWTKPRNIFVNSMSDLFHEKIPKEYIQKVFKVMREAHWHRFQILTKRPEVLLDLDPEIEWAENIWMGVSVENQKYTPRIDLLRKCGAQTRFLSLEPLLGPLEDLDLSQIDWVIVGGESGPKARPMKEEWALSLRDQCLKAKTPFFFKQWGGVHKRTTGRTLQGKIWNEMPI